MRLLKRLLACLALPALALALAAPAQGGVLARVKVATHESGPFTEEVEVNVANGQTKSLWWRVKSTAKGGQDLAFVDNDSSNSDGYKTKWFQGAQNISSEVKGEGYTFHIGERKTKLFKATVTRTAQSHNPFCLVGGAYDFIDADFAFGGINEDCET